MTNAEKIGIHITEILLPGKEVDLHKWAAIAVTIPLNRVLGGRLCPSREPHPLSFDFAGPG